jgi:hypothetical protein
MGGAGDQSGGVALATRSWLWLTVAAAIGASGCAARAEPASDAQQVQSSGPRLAPEAAGLRLAVLEQAREVCMTDTGCAGNPKGSTRIKPLEPMVRSAVADALRGIGFEVVGLEAERDMSADVEWRGTDTLALRLRDARGRQVEEVSFRRNLARCGDLGNASWESCWQANFPQMKVELSRPLAGSAALAAFARRARGGEPTGVAEGTSAKPQALAASASTQPVSGDLELPERLEAAHVQATVARYRETMKRQCWQPALEARAENASTSARVSLSVIVTPSGGVDNVTSLGDPPGYPRLGQCLAAQLAQWQFPPSKSRNTLSIPFVFTSE